MIDPMFFGLSGHAKTPTLGRMCPTRWTKPIFLGHIAFVGLKLASFTNALGLGHQFLVLCKSHVDACSFLGDVRAVDLEPFSPLHLFSFDILLGQIEKLAALNSV